MKLGRALRRKLEKKSPYWTIPEMNGLPFVLAIQDFHLTGTMRAITQAATDYVFGVRHTIENGKIKIERINHHVWGKSKEKSGFFSLPGSENVSAVIVKSIFDKGQRIDLAKNFKLADMGKFLVHIVKRSKREEAALVGLRMIFEFAGGLLQGCMVYGASRGEVANGIRDFNDA